MLVVERNQKKLKTLCHSFKIKSLNHSYLVSSVLSRYQAFNHQIVCQGVFLKALKCRKQSKITNIPLLFLLAWQFGHPRIRNQCLAKVGLKFLAFKKDSVFHKFCLINSRPEDWYNLDLWKTFLDDNPRTAAGMYQSWCQKIT